MCTVVQAKCHGIDCAGNLVQVIFQDNKLLRSATRNVQWALDNCLILTPNGSEFASNEIYIFKQVRVQKVEDVKKSTNFWETIYMKFYLIPTMGGKEQNRLIHISLLKIV